MYHFHQDEEALAWRIIGLAARMCLELGLHRRETLLRNFEGEEERSQATTLFWSIYVLDRRWSFGTGIPFALQDADIDPALPEPVSYTCKDTCLIMDRALIMSDLIGYLNALSEGHGSL
jgi:hypothetical protein